MTDKKLFLFMALFGGLTLYHHIEIKKNPDISQINKLKTGFQAAKNWIGKEAPKFDLVQMDGTTFSLGSVIGKKVVVLNFFATWCGPCKLEMPELNRFYQSMKEKDVLLIGIDGNETKALVKNFMREYNVSFPVGIDTNGTIMAQYGVNSYPTTIVVGIDGKIQFYETGAITNVDVSLIPQVKSQLLLKKTGLFK